MYKVLRKCQTCSNNELANWPKPLQNRVMIVLERMKGYYVEPRSASVRFDGEWLHVELRGEEGWFVVHESTGTGSFEPHNDNTRKVFRAFYTP